MKGFAKSMIGLAAAGAIAGAYPAPVSADEAATAKSVWEHHLKSAMSHDLDAIMTDFTEESAIVTPGGVFKGKSAIRGFLAEAVKGFTPEAMKSMVVNAETVDGGVVFFNYTVGAAKRTFSDTAVIKNGKIAAITAVNYQAE